jgi:hypothetical protein
MKLPFGWSPNQGSGSWWNNQEKGGFIMIQPSHLREMLVCNIVTTGHHTMTISPNYSLERKNNKIKNVKRN